MNLRRVQSLGPLMLGVVLVTVAACSAGESRETASPVNGVDPYLARALNDPLMVDPDLAYRNEANAAITIGYDHALPSFRASDEEAGRAREVARLELLEDGPIVDLPEPRKGPGPVSLDQAFSVPALLDAVEAPMECRTQIKGGFAFASSMPEIARVMPHGMVRQAAAVDQPGCELRVVRYVTPVAIEDALQYHYTMAERSQLAPAFYTAPEASLIANRRGTHLQVFARRTAGNLSAIDVITWTLP